MIRKEVEKETKDRRGEEIMKKQKGITLIALVVTIIVLLLLAGVSITTLIDQDNIFKLASTSKEKTNIADEKEQIALSYFATMTDNKSTSVVREQLEEKLKKYNDEITVTEDKEDFIVEFPSENKYSVNSKGDIVGPLLDPEKLTVGKEKAINTDKYGWKVKKYNVKYECGTDLSDTSDVWRLFYQDEKYAYLITDELVGEYFLVSYYSKYTDGSQVSIVGQKLNEKVSSLFTAEETKANTNIRATAWLTDTSENGLWSKYKDENKDASFAIASPTLELLAASYNNNTSTSHQQYKNGNLSLNLDKSWERSSVWILSFA